MMCRVFLIFPAVLLLTAVGASAGTLPQVIQEISYDIKNTSDSVEKSQLHIFRARQYTRIKKLDNALEDYNLALEMNHKGWIHLERSQFLMLAGQYELAYEDAKAARKETPTLALEADIIIDKSVAEIRKQYEADNPPTIIMSTVVNPYRKTRFDIMREQGVFAADARRNVAFNEQKTAKRKSKKTACKPKSSKSG